jgi:nucleoside-diphosphate kinase
MSLERTLSIIKPDAVKKNLIGKINAKIESSNLRIIAQKMLWITLEQAEKFYAVHAERSFFLDLCTFMSSGPIVAQVLEGNNAVVRYREIMGATNPINAEVGTIRKDFAESVDKNAVHGSDSIKNAIDEISFFFSQIEIVT